MPLATTLATHRGLGVPLSGPSEIRFDSTADGLTLTLSTSAGAGLVVRSNMQPGSTIQSGDIFKVSSAGGAQILSGTTVLVEINSSGLDVGGNTIITTLARHAGGMQTVTITTGSTLVSSNAGKMHILTTGASSNFLYVPTSAAGLARVGDYWDVMANTSIAGQLNISQLGANGGGSIFAHVGTTGSLVTTGAIENLTSGPYYVRIVCVTSGAAPDYIALPFSESVSAATTNYYGGFAAGTTA